MAKRIDTLTRSLFDDDAPVLSESSSPKPATEEMDGITESRIETLIINLPGKEFKNYDLQVYLAQGDSGTWYNAANIGTPVGTRSYWPWPKFSEKYADRSTALEAACEIIYKGVLGMVKDEKVTRKIAVALSDFCVVEFNDSKPTVQKEALENVDTTERDAGRDSICKEWRGCLYAEACMDETINVECVCYRDEPHLIPTTVLSRDELKVAAAGFLLVKYHREEKKLQISETDTSKGWTALDPFPTFAAAERRLKELKAKDFIESDLQGKIVMSGWNQPGGLLQCGFEFYRSYGMAAYQIGCCIKQGSSNWSNLAKYSSPEELATAWYQLMQNQKALEG